jgi:hypothetical protein
MNFTVSQVIKITNASLNSNKTIEAKAWEKFPNGLFKVTMKVSDESDDKIMELTYFNENKYHFRDPKF